MSEPLSILLHAAARGAQLQIRYGKPVHRMYCNNNHWRPMNTDAHDWRIAPKDHHLRYGPISRVLFEAAKNPPDYFSDLRKFNTPADWAAKDYAFSFKEAKDLFNIATKEQRSFFLLLVAEALAHEGL